MNFGRVPKPTKRAWIHKIQPIRPENRPETQMNPVRFLDSNPGPRTVKLRDTPPTTPGAELAPVELEAGLFATNRLDGVGKHRNHGRPILLGVPSGRGMPPKGRNYVGTFTEKERKYYHQR